MTRGTNTELEQFRRRWQEEVTARASGLLPQNSAPSRASAPRTASEHEPSTRTHRVVVLGALQDDENDEGRTTGYEFELLNDSVRSGSRSSDVQQQRERDTPEPEPVSALDHYERAVIREDEGNLGESLTHYRRAYRVRLQDMDLETHADSGSWMHQWINSTRTSTSPLPPRELPPTIQAMHRRQSQILLITRSTGTPNSQHHNCYSPLHKIPSKELRQPSRTLRSLLVRSPRCQQRSWYRSFCRPHSWIRHPLPDLLWCASDWRTLLQPRIVSGVMWFTPRPTASVPCIPHSPTASQGLWVILLNLLHHLLSSSRLSPPWRSLHP